METITKNPVSYNALLEDEAKKNAFFARNKYTVNGYKILMLRKQYHKGGAIHNDVSIWKGDRDDIDIYYDIEKGAYTIQTTSWGALTLEELNPLMEKYRRAIAAVKWMQAFDWNTADILLDDVEL